MLSKRYESTGVDRFHSKFQLVGDLISIIIIKNLRRKRKRSDSVYDKSPYLIMNIQNIHATFRAIDEIMEII